MKVIEIINEMTMRGSNFDDIAEKFGQMNALRWFSNGKHIGDIEQYKVVQDGIYYSVWDNDVLIAFSSLKDSNNEVDDIWVAPSYRGQKIFSKLIWFYKTRLHKNRLMLGPVHSKTMQDLVVGMNRFNKAWVNIRTNEVEPFSAETVDDFYSYTGSTPWRLILENENDFTNWPMFAEGKSFIKETYSEYID